MSRGLRFSESEIESAMSSFQRSLVAVYQMVHFCRSSKPERRSWALKEINEIKFRKVDKKQRSL